MWRELSNFETKMRREYEKERDSFLEPVYPNGVPRNPVTTLDDFAFEMFLLARRLELILASRGPPTAGPLK